MKWVLTGLLMGFLLLGARSSYADVWIQPKVALHVSAPTSKYVTICTDWSPNNKWISCSDYAVEGPTGQELIVYMVVAQNLTEVGGVSMGIEYNGAAGAGVDVFGWTLCADGLEFPNEGPRGDWPASGAGNIVTWLENADGHCPSTHIGPDGMHAVVGSFSVYAYSADQLKVTPNRNLMVGPTLSIASCGGAEWYPDTLSTLGWAGFGLPGRNPCVSEVICPPIIVDSLEVDLNTSVDGSNGDYIKVHLELWHGFGLALLDRSSIRLNLFVSASAYPIEYGDWNLNGFPDVTLFFRRLPTQSIIQDGDQVPVQISGLIAGCPFSATDIIRFIRPRLLDPNGGEFLVVGTQKKIEWENPDGWPVSYVQIQYSSDGGSSWSLVADHVSGESYAWTVPQVPTENGLLRIVLFDSEGLMGYDASNAPFTVTTCPAVPVQAMDVDPNTLNAGAHGNYVTAHVELPDGQDLAQVDLGSIRLNKIVDPSPDFFEIGDWNGNGVSDFMVKFPRWVVEAYLPEGDQVQVTITGAIAGCPFSGTHIVRVIRPHLVHPNGGELYLAGSRKLVEWENPSGWTAEYARIYYSPDGGDGWSLIADQVSRVNYVWAIPEQATEAGLLRVVLVDAEGVMGYDTSDGPFTVRSATGIGDAFPAAYRLHPGSPNPFQGATRATFDMPEPGQVTLKVFDLSGRVVRVLADGAYSAGSHSVSWNARDSAGEPVAAGIYFLHMTSGSFADARRLYLQK